MATGNDLDGLIRFIGRSDTWHDRLADVLGEHLAAALEEFDVDFEDLGELLGESWPMVLWGCGFEDLLGRSYDGETVADLYLKRQGWTESAPTRAYIEGLRDAPVSLYEVSAVEPGASMVLQDLLTDGEPVTVREKSATRTLKRWDRIAVRVVHQRDHHVISGALLPFPPEAVDLLSDGLRHALEVGERKPLRLSPDQLRRCAPLFSNAWVFAHLARTLDPEPMRLSNTDGDELVFHDLRFPFAAGVTQNAVSARLSRIATFEPAAAKVWHWLDYGDHGRTDEQKGLVLGQSIAGATVLGTLEMKGSALTLSVNSAARAKRGEALILDALGDLLKPPLTALRTLDQVAAEHDGPQATEPDEIPPDTARRLAHEHLDRHYRDALDQPIPALGHETPRQAIRSATGRRKVVEWLKLIENRSAAQTGSPLADYDFAWMWDELGLARLRK